MNRQSLPEHEIKGLGVKGSGKFRLGYRSSLDGLRGVAILSVVFAHAARTGITGGPIGVDIFFVLSGFLITCLLLEEWDQFQSIGLKAFYARRALRLLPALVVMLATLLTFSWLSSPKSAAMRTTIDAVIALFYSTNWAFVLGFRQPAHVLTHTWSLSIEEQFYLTWPAILILMLRRSSSSSSMVMWLILALCLMLLEKVVILVTVPTNGLRWVIWATECRGEPLLVGCVMAIVLSSGLLPHRPNTMKTIRCLAWCLAAPLLVLLSLVDAPAEFSWIGLHLTAALCTAAIMLPPLLSETGVIHRVLDQPWLVYIGKISYGLYLWHYPIFVQVQAQRWPAAKEYAAEVALTVTATLASFYLLERPILRFKRRFVGRGIRA